MPRSAEILLIEDNPADAVLTREALIEAKVDNNLSVVGDGEAALDYLNQRGDYVDAKRPDIVLLDLSLPGIDGKDVLRKMKAAQSLKSIPVLVLTGSHNPKDIKSVYELKAQSYLVKPIDMSEFLNVVRTMNRFRLNITTGHATPQ